MNNKENSLLEFFKRALHLHDSLEKDFNQLMSDLKPENNEEAELNIKGVARSLLFSSHQLDIQILEAIRKKQIQIAFCGLRTLLEYDIKTQFIFDNPKRKNDDKWISSCSKDIFETTNSIEKLKNKIMGSGLKEMAVEIERIDLIEKNYAALCDYVHLPIRSANVLFWEKEIKESNLIVVAASGVAHFAGIISSIGNFMDYQYNRQSINSCVEFYDEMCDLKGNK